jgi:hypothetical protein
MSESVLFMIGTIVFAITVYGAVMAGGLMLTRRELEQDEDPARTVPEKDLHAGLPTNTKW